MLMSSSHGIQGTDHGDWPERPAGARVAPGARREPRARPGVARNPGISQHRGSTGGSTTGCTTGDSEHAVITFLVGIFPSTAAAPAAAPPVIRSAW